jgi:hypothetical protein
MDTYGEGGASTLNIFYSAEVIGEAPETLEAKDDVAELAWFPLDALPLDGFTFEDGKRAIADWRSSGKPR